MKFIARGKGVFNTIIVDDDVCIETCRCNTTLEIVPLRTGLISVYGSMAEVKPKCHKLMTNILDSVPSVLLTPIELSGFKWLKVVILSGKHSITISTGSEK